MHVCVCVWVYITTNKVSGGDGIPVELLHPAFSHWCRQEYLGGPAHAMGGKSTLLGTMDDPQGILCSQGGGLIE